MRRVEKAAELARRKSDRELARNSPEDRRQRRVSRSRSRSRSLGRSLSRGRGAIPSEVGAGLGAGDSPKPSTSDTAIRGTDAEPISSSRLLPSLTPRLR